MTPVTLSLSFTAWPLAGVVDLLASVPREALPAAAAAIAHHRRVRRFEVRLAPEEGKRLLFAEVEDGSLEGQGVLVLRLS